MITGLSYPTRVMPSDLGPPTVGAVEEQWEAASPGHAIPERGRAPDSENTGSSRRRIIGRVVLLAATAICLYVLAPSLLKTFGSLPQLREVFYAWFPVVAGLEALVFVSVWQLTRLALGTRGWFDVACSQLAGNALSRGLPGGAATGGTVQVQMLAQAGFDRTRTTTALTAVGLLSTATLFVLPVLALIPVLFGLAVNSQLLRGAVLAGIVGVFLVLASSALLTSDRLVRGVGRLVDWIRTHVRRRRSRKAPMADRLLESRHVVRATLAESWARAVGWSVGSELFDFLALQASLFAVGARVNPALVLLAYVAASALAMIPITPGGLGFVEAGLTGVLTLAGVTPDQAVVATLLYRLFSYWAPLPAGVVASGLFRRRARRGRFTRVG
jgi:uncharacterized protein (TIRG00374 family)